MNPPRGFPMLDDMYDQERAASSLPGTASTSAAYGVFIVIFIYYTFQYLSYTYIPFSEIMWNSAVWLTPSRVISILDDSFQVHGDNIQGDGKRGFDSDLHTSKSNVMRRVLGLDGAGLLTRVQRTRTISNLGSVLKPRSSNSLPGLGNWDNSCYQNSVLQGLAALQSLPPFLDQITRSDISQPTSIALKNILGLLNDPTHLGRTFWTPAALKSMSSWQQQDAQEYLSKISGELEKDAARHIKATTCANFGGMSITEQSNTPFGTKAITGSLDEPEFSSRIGELPEEMSSLILQSPLEGLLAQRVGCQQCRYVEGLSLVPFNCLTVPLGRQLFYDIRTRLDEYTALEPISGVECAKCTLLQTKRSIEQLLPSLQKSNTDNGQTDNLSLESLQQRLQVVDQALEEEDFSDHVLKKCNIPTQNRVSTTKSRQAVIARPPKALVIHVNRSNFDELTGVQSKNLAKVRFPYQLDLGPWCLGCPSASDRTDNSIESWNTDPSTPMLPDDEFADLESNRKYELRAVITHYGQHENGHYICYRKSPCYPMSNEKGVDETSTAWWRLSDETVTKVDEDTVLNQGGVFMLFYERIEPPMEPLTSLTESPEASIQVIVHSPDTPQTSQGTIPDVDSSLLTVPPNPAMSAEVGLPTPPQTPLRRQSNEEPTSEIKEPDTIGAAAVSKDAVCAPPSPTPESLEHSAAAKPEPPPDTTPPTESKPSELSKLVSNDIAALKEIQPVSPVSMRTAAPRARRGSGNRAGKAMHSVAGFVQAN